MNQLILTNKEQSYKVKQIKKSKRRTRPEVEKSKSGSIPDTRNYRALNHTLHDKNSNLIRVKCMFNYLPYVFDRSFKLMLHAACLPR